MRLLTVDRATHAPLTPFAVIAGTPEIPLGDEVLAIGDADGDGCDDLAIATQTGATAAMVLIVPSADLSVGLLDADTVQRRVYVGTAVDEVLLLLCGDMTGDGRPDLAVEVNLPPRDFGPSQWLGILPFEDLLP